MLLHRYYYFLWSLSLSHFKVTEILLYIAASEVASTGADDKSPAPPASAYKPHRASDATGNVLQMINEHRRFSVSAASAKSATGATGGVTGQPHTSGRMNISVAALHQGAPGQMTWLRPIALLRGGVAQWLARRALTGELYLIYA